MLPQFTRRQRLTPRARDLAVGSTIFVLGLIKKVVIADGVSGYATPAFDAADLGVNLSMAAAWTATLAYTFQLYFNFSGYSDMAIGLARLFGIRLPLNFDAPYRSTSIIDFWRRWHMTLSRFLRDYVYIPLGGNRHGTQRRYTST
jgi:D-alanyl-lipoteichoic acid acyltransferase DltB (MBOAT superfamily)